MYIPIWIRAWKFTSMGSLSDISGVKDHQCLLKRTCQCKCAITRGLISTILCFTCLVSVYPACLLYFTVYLLNFITTKITDIFQLGFKAT